VQGNSSREQVGHACCSSFQPWQRRSRLAGNRARLYDKDDCVDASMSALAQQPAGSKQCKQ
jgi:hypothetical protein